MDAQGVLHAVFSEADAAVRVTVVGSAGAWTGPYPREAAGILAAVLDDATGSLRVVQVS